MRGSREQATIRPWMTSDPEGVRWYAWALRNRAGLVADAVAAIQGAAGARGASAELGAVFAAIEAAASAFDTLADALSEHAEPLRALRDEVEGHRAPRTARLAIRERTDALSRVDAEVRRDLEAAVRGLPEAGARGWGEVLGLPGTHRLGGLFGAETAPARPPASAETARIRRSLARRPMSEAVFAVARDPRVRARLAEEPPPPASGPAASVLEAAGECGVPARLIRDAKAAAGNAEQAAAGEMAAAVDAVRAVFDVLGPASTRLVWLWPRAVASLAGAPVEVRAAANRALVRVEAGHARRVEPELEARAAARAVSDTWTPLRALRARAVVAYAQREALRQVVALPVAEPGALQLDLRARIRLYLRLLTETGPGERPHSAADAENGGARPRRILHFDPRGHGQVVEMVGPFDARTRTLAVLVPGTGSGLYGYHRNLETCHDLAAADPSGRTAVVCWVGGMFPSGMLTESSSPVWARRSGPALTRDVLALAAAAGRLGGEHRPRVVVIGHSYGAVVLGEAEKRGVPLDVAVYLAAAGAGPGVRTVSAYADIDPAGRPRTPARYACTAPGDPIRAIRRSPWGRLGADPAGMTGVIEFEAGVWEAPTAGHAVGEPVVGRAGHVGVITRGTTAFRILAGIVTGTAG